MTAIGANLTKTYTADELSTSGIGHAPGDRYVSHDGKEYIFAQANGAVTGAGYVCAVDETYQAAMLTTSGGGALGDPVGVASAAVADNSYGWFQIYGPCDIEVAASAAANTVLAATSTGGQLDDAVGKTVTGLVLTTARAASAGVAPGILNYPSVGATTS